MPMWLVPGTAVLKYSTHRHIEQNILLPSRHWREGSWGLEAALSRSYEFVQTGEMLAVVACWPSMSLQSVAEQEMASLFLAAGPAASAHKQGWRGEGV